METNMPTAKPTPGKMLLSPTDHTLILIDFQSQMAFATKSIDPVMLQRDWARAATYDATTGLAKTFGGAYGLGLICAGTMLGPHASEAGKA
jgi:hypothetical protein